MASEDASLIFVARNGETLGEYPVAEIRERLQSGRFVTEDFGWHDGLPDWLPITELMTRFAPQPSSQERSWRDDAATEKQLNYLKTFGISPTPNLTKGEASDLIENASTDPQALAYQAANRDRQWQERRVEEARFPSYYLKEKIREAAKELEFLKSSKADAKKTITLSTRRVAELEKRKVSETDEFKLIDLNNEIENCKADIEEAQSTLDDYEGSLQDAQDELKTPTSLRISFWKATFKRDGVISVTDSDELIDYADTIESLYGQYGSFFKVPTNKQISDILHALDAASNDWDRREPHSFYATLRASFPDQQRTQTPRARKVQSTGCLLLLGFVVTTMYGLIRVMF